MVRVVSQNFSPPRSRHSSGETDRDLAERANVALSVLGRKRVDLPPECESSSDSFWDSEQDGDHGEAGMSGYASSSNDINGNATAEKSDVHSKRKERRRERNKLSAQAYRQRRRTQCVKEQQTLMELEAENKRLHSLVENLEMEKEYTKHLLRGCPLQPIGEVELASADMSDSDAGAAAPKSEVTTDKQLFALNYNQNSSNLPIHGGVNNGPNLPPSSFENELKTKISTTDKQVHDRVAAPVLGNDQSFAFTVNSQQISQHPAAASDVPNQVIFNTNVLIGTAMAPPGNPGLASIPTILTVPIEHPNSNLNCNALRACPTITTTIIPPYPESQCPHTQPGLGAPQFVNAIWLSDSQMKPAGSPITGTILGVISMDLCNNKSMNASDANGNDSCDQVGQVCPGANSQPLSFNINLNQTLGAVNQAALCQSQLKVTHPVVSLQCMLTPREHMPTQ